MTTSFYSFSIKTYGDSESIKASVPGKHKRNYTYGNCNIKLNFAIEIQKALMITPLNILTIIP
jgi:hypothetical protein